MATEMKTLREALKGSEHNMASGSNENNSRAASSAEPDKQERQDDNIDRRKVARIARDRMMEGYAPSANSKMKSMKPMSPIEEEHHQTKGREATTSSLVLR